MNAATIQPYQEGIAEGSYWGDKPDFLTADADAERKNETLSEKKESVIMSTTAKPIAEPRGGLAAEAKTLKTSKARSVKPKTAKAVKEPKAPKAKKEKSASGNKGRLGKLFDSSVVRVVMAAGKAGATYDQVQAVLTKHGIKAAEATVKRNLYLGKSGTMKGAELTKAQLAEFGV